VLAIVVTQIADSEERAEPSLKAQPSSTKACSGNWVIIGSNILYTTKPRHYLFFITAVANIIQWMMAT
jgi:hypothetical protein